MLAVDSLLLQVLRLLVLALQVWALADATYRPAAYYPAAGKWTKPGWVGVLVVGALLSLLLGVGPFSLVTMAAVVAAVVYLVDVRPALRGIRPGGPWA